MERRLLFLLRGEFQVATTTTTNTKAPAKDNALSKVIPAVDSLFYLGVGVIAIGAIAGFFLK